MANPNPKKPPPGHATPWRKSFIPASQRRVKKQARAAGRAIARMRND